MFRIATELVINISSEWIWLAATAIRSFAPGRSPRWMSLKRKEMNMTESAEMLTTFKPQPAEQIKAEHDAGLASPTVKDRDVTVMADRFAKMSIRSSGYEKTPPGASGPRLCLKTPLAALSARP